jgi:hypothetical protein
MRSSRKTVNFVNSFTLKGLGGTQPAGDYVIVTDEERISTVLFEAWRRTSTQIRLPSLARDTGIEQYVTVDAAELEAALLSDSGLRAATPARQIHD